MHMSSTDFSLLQLNVTSDRNLGLCMYMIKEVFSVLQYYSVKGKLKVNTRNTQNALGI